MDEQQLCSFLESDLVAELGEYQPRAADDATADCSATMKSMKPSGRPVDDEPKAFHHVAGPASGGEERSCKRGFFCLESNG